MQWKITKILLQLTLVQLLLVSQLFVFNSTTIASPPANPINLTTNKPPTDEAAIEQLKQSGEYASLQKAFHEAQQEQLATSNTTAIASDFQQYAYVKASNTDAGDGFGYSVAIDGDTVVIGAYGERSNATGYNGDQTDNSILFAGAVYVFVRTGTTWSQQAYLKASNPEEGDAFGREVSISGDTLIVGTFNEDSGATGVNGEPNNNNAPESGAVYVFVRTGTTWSQQAYLKASNTDSNDLFGYSLAISGDTIVVGATGERSSATGINGNQSDNSANGSGAVYVFVRNGTTWSQEAYIKASNSETFDGFGMSVAIDGDTIIVGAGGEDSSALGINGDQNNDDAPGSGAVYVFVRSGTTWTQQAYVKPPVAKPCRGGLFVVCPLFGSVVDLSGDTMAVLDKDAVTIYIFVRNGNDWSQQAVIPVAGYFWPDAKLSLGLSGDRVVVGKIMNSAAYVFVRTGTTWSQEASLQTSNAEPDEDPAVSDNAGYSLAISGDRIVIGAPAEDSNSTGINGNQNDNSAIGAGAAYIFSVVPSTTPTCAALVQEAETSNAVLSGFSIANDPAASGGSYIGAPAGGLYYNGANPSFKAEYCFNVPTSGTYRIKAKTHAANDLSDSFYVTVDGAPTNGYLWDVAQNTTYTTDYVNDRGLADPVELNLTAGQHTLTVYLREQGTRLDTIELEAVPTTPDPVCEGLLQEAESGVISGDWEIAGDLAASGGAYIAAPNGSGDFWNGASASQKASFCFNVTTAGSYRIRGKVYGADTLSDSFYVQVDGQPSTGYLWDILPNTTYASDLVNDRGVADPVEVQLSAGQHTVDVFVREDGTRLDTIELQLVDSGPPPTPTCAGLTQEAETGALSGNFAIGSDTAASGGQYVGTPSGSGDFWNGPNANHKAEYCFNIDTAGSYRIDGKVYGIAPLSDSFYVTVDGQPTGGYLWDILPNTTYAVDAVNDRNQLLDEVYVNLTTGQHTVTIYARESGTRLDTISLNSVAPTVQSRAMNPLAAGIGGTVRVNATNLTSEIDFSTITVTLLDAETNGAAFSQTVTADRFGNYHFDGMTPGSYIVQLSLPSGLVASSMAEPVEATREEPVTVDFVVNGETAGGKTYLPLINR